MAREYRFSYQQAAFNGVSLLTQVDVVGIDDQDLPPGQDPATEHLPPLTFGYSGFDPAGRRFERADRAGLPTAALSRPDPGPGGPARRSGCPTSWNSGAGRNGSGATPAAADSTCPVSWTEAPPVSLADPGVQLLDADGDGRPDLVVSATIGTVQGREARWPGTSR